MLWCDWTIYIAALWPKFNSSSLDPRGRRRDSFTSYFCINWGVLPYMISPLHCKARAAPLLSSRYCIPNLAVHIIETGSGAVDMQTSSDPYHFSRSGGSYGEMDPLLHTITLHNLINQSTTTAKAYQGTYPCTYSIHYELYMHATYIQIYTSKSCRRVAALSN